MNIFRRKKFHVGDSVMVVDNLETKYRVIKSYIRNDNDKEYVMLSNFNTYCACDVTFYSQPIALLAKKIKELVVSVNSINAKNNLESMIDELADIMEEDNIKLPSKNKAKKTKKSKK